MKKHMPLSIIAFFLIIIVPSTLNADQNQDRFDARLKEGMENVDPIGEKLIKNTTPTEAFKYFSGNKAPVNCHPAIYAGDDKLFVVGFKFNKEFSVKEFDKAIEAYKELLKLDGYLISD